MADIEGPFGCNLTRVSEIPARDLSQRERPRQFRRVSKIRIAFSQDSLVFATGQGSLDICLSIVKSNHQESVLLRLRYQGVILPREQEEPRGPFVILFRAKACSEWLGRLTIGSWFAKIPNEGIQAGIVCS